jgi:hypothetical protein
MAVPDRVNLFRAQAMRSVGGNVWRMSHNPPIPMLLDILDRVGITVLDENREFGNNTEFIYNMGELVKRDRNHPSSLFRRRLLPVSLIPISLIPISLIPISMATQFRRGASATRAAAAMQLAGLDSGRLPTGTTAHAPRWPT